MPALTKEVDLVVGVDASFEMESQMEVQQGFRRTGTRHGTLFCQGRLPGRIRAETRGAANGGVLALNLSVENELCGRIAADFFIGQDGDQNDNSAGLAGAAYVFVRNGTNWTQQAYLKASNTRENYEFGYSVSVSGDTVVVGSHSDATRINGDVGGSSKGDFCASSKGDRF